MSRSRTIRTLVVIALIIGVVLVVQFGLAAWRLVEHSKSEYPTAAAIWAVTEYVEKHDGRWPATWDDLAFPQDQRGQVHLRFDVTAKQILDEPDLIHNVIKPVTGPFRVYPHSKEDLDFLLGRLKALNETPVNGA